MGRPFDVVFFLWGEHWVWGVFGGATFWRGEFLVGRPFGVESFWWADHLVWGVFGGATIWCGEFLVGRPFGVESFWRGVRISIDFFFSDNFLSN